MPKFLLVAVMLAALMVSGCSSDADADAVPDLSADKLYQQAQSLMSDADYSGAIRYLEALDSRYPFGALTDQVQLDLIYCYYKSRKSEMTSAVIARYLRLNPTGQYSDYVTYMKGLNEVQKHGDLIQDFIGLNRSQKDPSTYYEALQAFRELITAFPGSPYVHDARQRMLYIREQLAEREMHIASYYFEREAFLSAIRHCQSILYSFRNTSYLRPALEMMAKCYRRLGLIEPAQNTERVIAANYDRVS